MSKAQVSIPLEIPNVRVLKSELNQDGDLVITVESLKTETLCRKCGRPISKSHGHDSWVTVRHLPVFGRATYLRYRPKRYQCVDCEGRPTTTERLDWHESDSPHTSAYDAYLLLQLVNSTVEDVSFKENVSYDRVLGVLERLIATKVDWSQHTQLGVLGLDEIAIRKGHRDFVVIVTARLADGRVVLLGVLPDRKKKTVADFLRSIPERLKSTIHSACCDMYEGYTEALSEELPKVRIVIDRFHVAKTYRDDVDGLRKREMKRLKATLSEEEYKQLKGSLWVVRKKPQDLNAEQKQVQQLLFEYSPALKAAYDLQEQLSAIFDEPISKSVAETKIRDWIERVSTSGVKCFETFIKTLNRLWHPITNYFVARHTSAFVEGLNNKIKVLKRRCYGLFNLQHLFQRIFLDLEGYRLFASHPHIWPNHGNSQ
jgi:transposase